MAFLKTNRSNGGGDILINLDHVKELRPIAKKDRRTQVTFVTYDDYSEVQTLNVNADFDELMADLGHFDGTVLPTP